VDHANIRRFIRLPTGSAIAQHELSGRTLRIRRGRVWLTQHADIRDYDLVAGEEMRITNAGAVVIHALEATVIEVRADAPAPAPRFRDAIARLLRRLRAAPAPACPQ
jgi:hypothetical protein